ncbi:MAG: hypothetical protein EF812_07070 [Methanosarcinales archaeon]|nr:MAG: hypothetical protein EF812_07070 [Methanosarcinales archaeon]
MDSQRSGCLEFDRGSVLKNYGKFLVIVYSNDCISFEEITNSFRSDAMQGLWIHKASDYV